MKALYDSTSRLTAANMVMLVESRRCFAWQSLAYAMLPVFLCKTLTPQFTQQINDYFEALNIWSRQPVQHVPRSPEFLFMVIICAQMLAQGRKQLSKSRTIIFLLCLITGESRTPSYPQASKVGLRIIKEQKRPQQNFLSHLLVHHNSLSIIKCLMCDCSSLYH